ncbi:DUF2637 domain-containing protein [Kitasatospora camelliae]|uniref:DUF2637 domain-containing protein n=1 Tax=Kitasatospora camelliae TaxID=3156397 RepID=A0AAU8JUZ6_9ACTN
MARPSLTRAHRALLGVVAVGACLISGIGFAGSYNAVAELAMAKGFGAFSYAFPIGVDAGIVVLLALDLVLTWLRIPFPLLRQTAWLLTAATIAFNAAASWGDPLGMAMHAVIPVLFIVVIEASRHAVGRMAAITADRYMESVRMMRWLLSPVPTFRLWRRMKLWELRSYDETVRLEQNRLVYRAQLRFRYGRNWRRSAPFQALLPLKLAKYGVPLDPSILDRIDGPLHSVKAAAEVGPGAGAALGTDAEEQSGVPAVSAAVAVPTLAKLAAVRLRDAQEPQQAEQSAPAPSRSELNVWTAKAVRAHTEQMEEAQSARVPGQSPWFKPTLARPADEPTVVGNGQAKAPSAPAAPVGPAPARGGAPRQGVRAQGVPAAAGANGHPAPGGPAVGDAAPMRIGPRPVRLDGPMTAADDRAFAAEDLAEGFDEEFEAEFAEEHGPEGGATAAGEYPGQGRRAVEPLDPDLCFEALVGYLDEFQHQPTPQVFAEYLTRTWGLVGSRPDGSVSPSDLTRIWDQLQDRYLTSGRE